MAYTLLYVFHWVFVDDSEGLSITTMMFHLMLILIGLNLFFFMRADSSILNKKHISKDKDHNLIGNIMDLIESR